MQPPVSKLASLTAGGDSSKLRGMGSSAGPVLHCVLSGRDGKCPLIFLVRVPLQFSGYNAGWGSFAVLARMYPCMEIPFIAKLVRPKTLS